MKYDKPKIVAQNKTEGSYAAGCPVKTRGDRGAWCRACQLAG